MRAGVAFAPAPRPPLIDGRACGVGSKFSASVPPFISYCEQSYICRMLYWLDSTNDRRPPPSFHCLRPPPDLALLLFRAGEDSYQPP